MMALAVQPPRQKQQPDAGDAQHTHHQSVEEIEPQPQARQAAEGVQKQYPALRKACRSV